MSTSDVLIGAGTTLAGVGIGGWVTYRVARYQHDQDVKGRTVRAVAGCQVLLNEVNPALVQATDLETSREFSATYWGRLSPLMVDLRTAAMEQSGNDLGETFDELATAMVTSLNRTTWWLLCRHHPAYQENAEIPGYSAADALDTAMMNYADANTLVAALADELEESPRQAGRLRVTRPGW